MENLVNKLELVGCVCVVVHELANFVLIGKAVGWQKLLFRLRLLSVPGAKAREICQPLRRAILKKLGLPPGTAAAADSYVWMAEQDELAAERLLMLMRMMGGVGVV